MASSERLEDRSLLTLIGVDFGPTGSSSPANWTLVSGTTNTDFLNLKDESGVSTSVDLHVKFDLVPGSFDNFTPLTVELPIHSQSLAGLDGNYADQGNVELAFRDLIPGLTYDIFVFAGDTFADNQQVTIFNKAAGGTVISSFTQQHVSNQLVINSQVGDSAKSLSTYALSIPADTAGEINIRIDSSNGTFFSLAGVAIQEPAPPTGIFLNEIVSNITGGLDNPNEYVEIRGGATQSLKDVYLVFVNGTAGSTQGTIRPGVTNLSATQIGSNGFVAVIDQLNHPYAIAPGASILNIAGLEIGSGSFTAFLVHVNASLGTAPVAGQDLDSGNDGLDALPVGWTVLDSVSVLGGSPQDWSYAGIGFTANGNGTAASGSVLVNAGFTGGIGQVMRVGNSTGSTANDWAAFRLGDLAPNLAIQESTKSAYAVTALNTNHLGAVNPTSAAAPPPGLTLQIVAKSISENGGTTTATVRRNTDTTNPLTVALVSNDTGEATVAGTVTIAAGKDTSDPFTITAVADLIVDGTQVVTITASAGGHADGSGTIQITDNEAALSVGIIPAVISEGAKANPATGTVTRNTNLAVELIVSLSSSDTTEATVPPTVTIPAGQASAPFSIAAVDDPTVDGLQTVTVSATAVGFGSGSGTVGVADDDAILTLTIATSQIGEGDGPKATTATVSRNYVSASPVVVTLMSSDTTEANVVGTVTIPANQTTSAPFDINAIDDTIADGTRIVALMASAANHISAISNLSVLDDELPGLTLTLSKNEISEGGGVGAATATVSRNTDATSAMTVTLLSSDTTEAVVIATVIIPAGAATSEPFRIDAVDDLKLDGDQTVTITASSGSPLGLDATFGVGGRVALPVNAFFTNSDFAVQPDGKSVVAVEEGLATWRILRLNTDGTRDATFGTNGVVNISTLGAPVGIVIQPDGRIVMAGDGSQAAAVRLNADGSLDSGFGVGGYVDIGTFDNWVTDINLRSDGKILLAIDRGTRFRFALLNSDGTLDTNYGIGGIQQDNLLTSQVHDIYTLPNGDYIAAGEFFDMHVAFYNANGTRKSGFGNLGVVAVNLGTPFIEVRDILQDSSGRVLISGDASGRTFVVRLNVDGTLDTSFGGTGIVKPGPPLSGGDGSGHMVLQADGKILLGGTIDDPAVLAMNEAMFMRLNSNGTLDTTFDGDGVLSFDMPAVRNIFQEVIGVGIDSNGNLLALGGATSAFEVFRISTSDTFLQGSAAITVLDDDLGNWLPAGPFSATNGQVENLPGRLIAGAMHTVLAHPTNPDVLYAGSVNGGVWKTTNATSPSPTWIPLTDGLPSQSIGAMAFDTSDATGRTLYAGVGLYSSFNRIGNTRVGMYKTTDGGNTWTIHNGNGVLSGANISGVVAHGSNVVVSVNTADNFSFPRIGVFRSTDGGTTFAQVSVGNGSITGLPNGASYDLVADPTNPDILYTSTVFSDSAGGTNGIYRSSNGGATWSKVSNAAVDALILSNSTSNLELAVGRNNNVYAAIINFGNMAGLFRSGDGGVTWVQMDSPSTNENGTNVGLNPRGSKGPTAVDNPAPAELAGGQGNIHFSIVADPTNPNIVYVGGDRQPRSFNDTGSFPNSIGANDFSGRLFRGDASRPAGSQFVHLTHSNTLGAAGGGTASSSSPHADSRDMTFDANGHIIQVDDGGIYRRTNPRSNTGDWFSLTGDLQVTEIHDVAYDNLSNTLISGNQDTGTTYQPSEGAALWNSLHTGDGGDVVVDNVSRAASNQSVRYTSFQNLSIFRRTVWNADGSLASTSFPSLLVGANQFADGAFRTPVELNIVDPNRLIIQGNTSTYETLNQGSTLTSLAAAPNTNSGLFQNAVAYGGRQNGADNPDVLWVGSGSDVFVRTTAGGALAPVASDPTTGTVRDLAIDPDNWASAFVIDSNQVFSTSNVGAAWADVTGNLLTSTSITSLYSIAYITNSIVDAIAVGTNAGVYVSLVSSLGTWFELGGRLPTVLTFDLEYDAVDDILVAGTMGRGAWTLGQVADVLPLRPDVVIGSPTVTEGTASVAFTVTLSAPALSDVTLTLTTQNGTALAGLDYTAKTQQITIPQGSIVSPTPFTVTILNNAVPENIEFFTVAVQSVDAGNVDDTSRVGTGTIIDDDARLTVTTAATSISEFNGSTTVTITRNTPTTASQTVTLTSSDLTEATIVNSVTIPAGQTSVTETVNAVDELLVDGTQRVVIQATAAGHANGAVAIDVLDNDVPALSLILVNSTIIEPSGPPSALPTSTMATVRRNTATTGPLTVTILSDDTGEATVVGTVTILAGETDSAPFQITAVDDNIVDGTQTVQLTASAAGHANGTTSLSVLDRQTPTVSFSINNSTINETGGTAVVTATLSFATNQSVVIDFGFTGTATATTDYTAGNQITITPGFTSGTINITAAHDTLDEDNETIIVNVTSVAGAVISGTSSLTTTINDDDAPPVVTLAVDKTSITENAETAVFTVRLSAVSSKDVVVDLEVTGTATGSGVDYSGLITQVTIPAGQMAATVTVTSVPDLLDEGNESIVVGIVGATNATVIGIPQAAATIVDNDARPTVRVSLDRETIAENFDRAIITATLSAVSGQDVLVHLGFAGTATGGGTDYVLPGTAQILIPAGQIRGSTVITAVSDNLDEPDETVIINITSVDNAELVGTPRAGIVIIDTDVEPTVSLSVDQLTIPETGGVAVFTVALNTVSGKDVQVTLRSAGAAMGAGVDFSSTPLIITIPKGNLSTTVTVTAISDLLDEFDELVVVEFVSVVNGVENIVQQASTTIIDDDLPPSVTLSIDVPEIAENGSEAKITATLSAPSGKDVEVSLGTNGSATGNGVDYPQSDIKILIPAGSTTGFVTITSVADLLDEFDETVVVDITSVVNADTNGLQQVTVTILDDDPLPTVMVSVDISDISETGEAATFTATLSEVSGRDVVVNLGISGTAQGADTDYSLPTPSIIIPAGSLTGSVTVTAVEDLLNEGDETVIVDTSNVDFAIVSGLSLFTLTILDNDPLPVVDLSVDSIAIAENGGVAVFTATLSEVSGRDVTVNLQTLSGATGGGIDYTGPTSPIQIVIPAGATSGSISVTAVQDNLDEFDEAITLRIESLINATAGIQQIGTFITDDDPTPTVALSFSQASIAEASGTTTATLTLSAASGRDVTVDLVISGTATATTDYTPPPTQLVIPAGQMTITRQITAVQDAMFEGDETIFVNIGTATNALADTTIHAVVVADDDVATLTLSISPDVVNEASGAAAAIGTVTRNTNTAGALTVQLTSNDSGESTVPGSVTIPAGSASATFPIRAINDFVLDGTQTVTVTARAGGFVNGVDTLNVEDATVLVNLQVNSAVGNEAGRSAVTVTAVTALPVRGVQTLNLVVSGTGISSGDYTLSSTTITIPDGQTQGSVTFTVVDDAVVEALSEVAVLSMTGLTSGLAAGGTASQTITITDNDAAAFRINDVTVSETQSGTASATFTVTLDQAVDIPLSVNFATADDTAAAGNDYLSNNGTLNFLGTAGETQTITVSITGDTRVELDETFLVNLSGIQPSNRAVTLAKAQGTGTITNDDSAGIRIADVSQLEGNSGVTTFLFAVTLDAEVDAPISLSHLASTGPNGTATATDVTFGAAGTLAFAANSGGPQTLNIAVDVTGDRHVELDETFMVSLSALLTNGRNVTIADATAIGTIRNDDAALLTVDSVTHAEGNSGNTTYIFTVTLNAATDSPLTVGYTTVDGTATAADGDYVAVTNGSLSFAGTVGETKTISVTASGDRKVELTGSFFVDLVNLSAGGRNVSITGGRGTGTITNDDSAGFRIGDVSLAEGSFGNTVMTFTVSLDAEVDSPVDISYATADASATTSGGDYSAATGTLTFAANAGSAAQTRTVSVNVSGDRKVELDETFLLNLSGISAAGRSVTLTDSQGVGTILNDDSATLSINDISVREGNTGTTLFTFSVTLDADVDNAVSVDYATEPDSARLTDGDFVSASGRLSFSANSASGQTQTFTVAVQGDDRVELDEVFFAGLLNFSAGGRNVTVVNPQARGTILNDDVAVISIGNASIAEGNSGSQTLTFTVTMQGTADSPVEVNFGTVAGTATISDNDYVPANGTLTFTADTGSSQTRTVAVTINGDQKVELDETFLLNLSSIMATGRDVRFASGTVVTSATGTITSTDSATISINDVTVLEGNSGTASVNFTVTLSAAVDTGISLTHSTQNETATAGQDYFGATATGLTIPAGVVSQTISVVVTGDRRVEFDESFLVNLSGLVTSGRNVTVADATGRAVLTNDDNATISINDVSVAEGNFGGRSLTFIITLSNEVESDVTVNFSTAPGTATTTNNDYVARTQVVRFPANSAVPQTVTIQVLGDTVFEQDETLFGNLSGLAANAASVVLADAQGLGTIINDDTEPPLPLPGDIDGDNDFDANDGALMQLILLGGFDNQIEQSKGSSPLSAREIRDVFASLIRSGTANVDGDNDTDANDLFLINLVLLSGTDADIERSKGASPLSATDIRANVNALRQRPGSGSLPRSSSQAATASVFAASPRTKVDAGSSVVASAIADVESNLFDTYASNGVLAGVAAESNDDPATDAVLEEFRSWIDAL